MKPVGRACEGDTGLCAGRGGVGEGVRKFCERGERFCDGVGRFCEGVGRFLGVAEICALGGAVQRNVMSDMPRETSSPSESIASGTLCRFTDTKHCES